LAIGAHGWIKNVVTDAVHGAPAYQVALANLRAVAAHVPIVRMTGRETHLRPHLERSAANTIAPGDELLISSVTVEKVELD